MSAQTEIQTLINTYRDAVMTKNVDKVMTLYTDDIVSFDAIKALQFKGKAAYRAHWEACMEMCSGPHVFEFHEIAIETRQPRLRPLGNALRRHQRQGRNPELLDARHRVLSAGRRDVENRSRALVGTVRSDERRDAVRCDPLIFSHS